MALLVSAKGSDLLAWRAAGDFAVTYRQRILDRMEFCPADEALAMLTWALHALEDLAVANDGFCSQCERMIAEVLECPETGQLRQLTREFFAGLYRQTALYHSAPAFFQFSQHFLQALAGALGRISRAQLEDAAARLPELALIALGPAGRQEFSPFCPLQFMLVHGEHSATDDGLIQRYATLLHEGFEACGLQVDTLVTPRNSQWRGSLAQWNQRMNRVLERGEFSEVVEILRLADQTQLDGAGEAGPVFRQRSLATLAASPLAMNNLVSRVVSLSNGIGMMGGLRFEKTGPFRGQFALLENALQPLSASMSAFGLLKQLEATPTPQRVRELLWRSELSVDMAERLLQAWHGLHERRLLGERDVHPDWRNGAPLHLDIEQMSMAEQEALRELLEAIGSVQHHLGLNFSGLEG